MIYEMTAGAAAAKKRQRGPTVSDRLRTEEAQQMAAGAQASRKAEKAMAGKDGVRPSSDGKARKTGMVLARAKLSSTTGGVVAAQERANSLLGKGTFRDAETLARQGPVGSLSTKDMPKRKDATSATAKAKHGKDFRAWMARALKSKVRDHLGICIGERRAASASDLTCDCLLACGSRSRRTPRRGTKRWC